MTVDIEQVTVTTATPGETATPTPPPGRAELVKHWIGEVQTTKGRRSRVYKRMRGDMAFARGIQWPGQRTVDDERYVVNITQRHIKQRVASLYARNPTFVAKRRPTLDFKIWDGQPKSLMEAKQIAAQAMDNPAILESAEGQKATALLMDVYQGSTHRQQLDKIAKTLETVFAYELKRQTPPFKKRMKRLVRRACTTGVGFMKLGYHRTFDMRPDDAARVNDITEQMAYMERLSAETADPATRGEHQAKAQELKYMLDALKNKADWLTKEGLDFDFPASTSIIVDMACTDLDGFVGAQWIAQEFLLTPGQVREIYGVDIHKDFQAHAYNAPTEPMTGSASDDETESRPGTQARGSGVSKEYAAVYEIYDKRSGLVYVVCDGYPDFLKEPAQPQIRLSRFWPIFTLTFNDVESDDEIYPPSDVELIKDAQRDMNLAKERLREHRDAARPDWVSSRAALDDNDAQLLQSSGAFRLLRLNSLLPGQAIKDILQPKPTAGIDPNLYETHGAMQDILLATGSQQANLGGTSSATATESSIANSSLTTALESDGDELDDFLTEVAQASGEVLLEEMTPDTAKLIAGDGGLWPELSTEDISRHVYLNVRAGSSGRPNRQQQIQMMERLVPFLIQIPGIDPHWLAEQLINRLDDSLDIEDAYISGSPSIVALNQAMKPSTGNPATDPGLQAPHGGEAPAAPAASTPQQAPNAHATGAPNTDMNNVPNTAPQSQG